MLGGINHHVLVDNDMDGFNDHVLCHKVSVYDIVDTVLACWKSKENSNQNSGQQICLLVFVMVSATWWDQRFIALQGTATHIRVGPM